jgi:hypothetical protein
MGAWSPRQDDLGRRVQFPGGALGWTGVGT